MIYFLHGTDTDKARAKARDLVASLQKKKPDAAFFTLNAENWDLGGVGWAIVDEYAGSQGLFANKYIVLVDRVGEDKARREELADKADAMAGSENIFIVVEGRLDKATVTKIEKMAEKTQEFMVDKSEIPKVWAGAGDNSRADSGPSIFVLSDALGRRDRRELWVLYRQFIDNDASPEEIHGALFWQVKSMVIAARAKSASDSGLAPFTYSKSKAFAANFTEVELGKLLNDLIEVSHDSRRGKGELETRLEVLLLSI